MNSTLAWQLPQNSGTWASNITAQEVALGLMGLDLEDGGIAAVTVLAAQALLPMNVAGKVLGGDEKPLLIFLGKLGMALNAGILVVRRAGAAAGAALWFAVEVGGAADFASL